MYDSYLSPPSYPPGWSAFRYGNLFWYLSSVVVPVCALRLLVSVLLLSACCAVCLCSGGCSCVCLRCPCLLSLLVASSPIGASAHVKHVAFSLPFCPLASCPVMVPGCTLVCLCTTCARARLCCGCGGWALLCSLACLQLLWLRQLVGGVFAVPPLLLSCFNGPQSSLKQ